ncbi:hypothetical protein FRC14_003881 [Serendipita sp. 396]|nr:hypothetical protein FRC14_003881 [Serendipita sp. 396]KAG8789486.1 hypothetical protein FRC15_008343 [Serendipita sp. 397]KAG8879072.1 hypothetical protein FRC20_003831 [Serendipita sp. 405]
MFRFFSYKNSPAPADDGQNTEGRDSASPPPPSVLTETATPVPAAPKPRKPRKSIKKAAAAEGGGDKPAEENANGTANGTAGEIKTVNALKELVRDVPPKTLHLFLMQRLDIQKTVGKAKNKPNPNAYPTLENDFPVLSSFFNGLVLPPKNHCLRCHSDYVDIENGPRSCVKEHDDDSAIVRRSAQGIHETFWGCCGQTVDGDGDQGPPTGWCYEGPHTTDREEARYRQDGTAKDDKLGDCTKLRCGAKKRKRPASEHSDSEDDTPIDALEPRRRHARRKSEVAAGVKGREQLKELLSDEDVEMSDASEEKEKAKKGRKSAGGRSKKSIGGKDAEEKEEKKTEKKADKKEEGSTPSKPAAAKKGGRASKGGKAADETPEPESKGTKKAAKKRKVED